MTELHKLVRAPSVVFVGVPLLAAAVWIALLVVRGRQGAGRDSECQRATRSAANQLESGLFQKALDELEANRACASQIEYDAVHAEALSLVDQAAQAEALANSVLQRDAKQRAALRARAGIELSARRFDTADTAIKELLRAKADDTSALYLKALLAMRRQQYNAARSGFLGVLRKSRRHVAARFGLVVLTAQSGVSDEAQHHLRELLEIAPLDDERRAQAERWVSSPHVAPNSRVLKLGSD